MQAANKVSQQQLTGASGQQVTCLRFTGDISSASKDAIVGTYQALDKASNKHILLDFKGVEYLNSSGIALVIQVLMEASKSGQTIAICGLTPHFTEGLHHGGNHQVRLALPRRGHSAGGALVRLCAVVQISFWKPSAEDARASMPICQKQDRHVSQSPVEIRFRTERRNEMFIASTSEYGPVKTYSRV